MGALTHLCCIIVTVQVVMTNWIQGANTLNHHTLTRQRSTLPPDLKKIKEEDLHIKERIVFNELLPSTSSIYQEHNNFKSYEFDSTSFHSSSLFTAVEQTYYKTTSLVVEETIGHYYYKQLSTSAPNNNRKMYQDNSMSNYYNLLMSKNIEFTYDNTFTTVSIANHIMMQIPSSTFHNITISSIVANQKNNQNHQHSSNIYFENIPTKHSHQFNVSLFGKYNSHRYSNSFNKNEEYAYLNSIKPTAVISDEFPVASINYTSSKTFGSLPLDSGSLVFNLTFIPEFQELKTSSSLSPYENNDWSSTKDEIEKNTSKNYKYLLNRDLKMFENRTSEPEINLNFSYDSSVSSRAVNISTREVPVLKTEIIKSNSIVLTNIRVKEKRFCRLCKTATEPLRNQDDFRVNMTSDNQYFPEPKTKCTVKEGNIIETKIPKNSNASLIIVSTVPPVIMFEPRTNMPTIPQTYISLPKSVTKNKLLYISTPYHLENSVSMMITEISKTLSFQEPETISTSELNDMEYSSNVLDTVSLYSSFTSSSEFTISHQKTAYLNLY